MKKSKKSQSSDKIKRTPVPYVAANEKNKNLALMWKKMRNAEKERKEKERSYSRYKNTFFISIIKEATGVEYWKKFDIARMKFLRKTIEDSYNIPINYFYAFVYFSTFHYMKWDKRSMMYDNYLGFISSEFNLVRFANYIVSKSISWRIKKSKFPDDYYEKWGIKTSAKVIKLGPNDEFVKHDLMSKKMKKKINKAINGEISKL
jgi:hypothetical protein